MEQDHCLAAALVFYMQGNPVSRNMMFRISRRRWTCRNQLTFTFKTSAKRGFWKGSSGCQYTTKPENERTTGIDGFLLTVIVHVPFFITWKIRFLRDCVRRSKIPEYNPWRSCFNHVHDH
jgi:hypothetical protein